MAFSHFGQSQVKTPQIDERRVTVNTRTCASPPISSEEECNVMRTGLIRLIAMASSAPSVHGLLEASCFCGKVHVRVPEAAVPQSVSICHCPTCRKLTGAPSIMNVMFAASDVEVDGALVPQQTSKLVTRQRCEACFSPVSASLGKGRVVLPASLFSAPHPKSWAPQHHLYYDRRVIDVHDELPKYRTHFGSTLWAGEAAGVVGDAPSES